ncbi:MAG TPA: Yip1 family protein [Anaerolineaceae bacterium]|nr:Yip1 family protein [Anaerolineaceae bacterium]
MLDRIIRAIRLDPGLYRKVADDEGLTGEAVVIVVVVALIGALGVAFSADQGLLAYILQVINSLLVGWLLWAVVAYFVGNALGGRSSIGEMARTLGYANAPRLLSVFGFIPCIGWIISLIGWVLSLAAAVIGIRESMEFDTTKALITAGIGFLVYLIAAIVIGIVFGSFAIPSQF